MNGVLGDDSALVRLYWAGDNRDVSERWLEMWIRDCPEMLRNVCESV